MKKFVFAALISSLLFPIVWVVLHGRELFEFIFLYDKTFLLATCVAAGLDAAIALYVARGISFKVSPLFAGSTVRCGGAVLAGILLATEGYSWMVWEGADPVSWMAWVVYAETPEFVSVYITLYVINVLAGPLIPAKVEGTPKRR